MQRSEDLCSESLRRERDLYRRLLELATRGELKPLLEEALALIVELSGARKGYLALYDEEQDEPRFALSRDCSDEEVAAIRRRISRGIVAEALATGETLNIDSAWRDPRFRDKSSVESQRIEAVLCAPIGLEAPLGVLYLQDRLPAGHFTEEDRQRAELFARHLAPAVDRLLLRERERERADETRHLRRRLKLEEIAGRSQALAGVLRQIEAVARFDIAVLLTGPSGTGKTALARALHENSPRAGRPFVELNCAAIPEGLFESELFGALQGAHSTATRRLPGKLSAAEGGTLFLDEVGELPLGLQSKLLQFLESKEYYPLGSARPERADVRVLSATNADLREAISQKSFREDLYYRLNVVEIFVPPLSARREDIAPLVEHFCRRSCEKHGLAPLAVAQSAVKAAEATDWPGNVRQLANAVEGAALRAAVENSPALGLRHLFPERGGGAPAEKPTRLFHEEMRRCQQRLLLEVLEASEWNVSEAARRLGLTRVHVYNLIHALGLRDISPRKPRTPQG